ncbi:hypothetical protein [Sporomusa acidovorans]|uniref:Uncharacterized protein n=1 Tax=Sporomusa acidovorans (strain ATCC 49682 / DSM 3132 / Mol) TaxID=1123286 RepID=A0ABZ3IWK4_SPOA4|nr:hypothetical protein [Sporomusa acidovorans]OZC13989.1 hypothetical protein SPACI_54210 [Sporomusa acidovorans DSM 3132]SDF21883.1 hypothetical protein SAMN04488499_103823 [Sporomusa acidovorans]
MSLIKNLLDFLYKEHAGNIRKTISMELDECQRTLEQQGFKVKRSEQLVNYEAAQCLTAEKGNVMLTATQFLKGNKDLSISVKHHGHMATMPFFSHKLDDAIAVVNAAQWSDKETDITTLG